MTERRPTGGQNFVTGPRGNHSIVSNRMHGLMTILSPHLGSFCLVVFSTPLFWLIVGFANLPSLLIFWFPGRLLKAPLFWLRFLLLTTASLLPLCFGCLDICILCWSFYLVTRQKEQEGGKKEEKEKKEKLAR